MLLAIDPGVCTGWATYEGTTLTGCGVGEDLYLNARGLSDLARVVIECPKLRPWGEKNPNAILTLARNAGEWGGRVQGAFIDCTPDGGYLPVEYVLPNDWKGSLTKEQCHPRLWAVLSVEEQSTVDAAFRAAKGRNGLAPSKRHNVLDAIGIGLWAVGRFGPGRG